MDEKDVMFFENESKLKKKSHIQFQICKFNTYIYI